MRILHEPVAVWMESYFKNVTDEKSGRRDKTMRSKSEDLPVWCCGTTRNWLYHTNEGFMICMIGAVPYGTALLYCQAEIKGPELLENANEFS